MWIVCNGDLFHFMSNTKLNCSLFPVVSTDVEGHGWQYQSSKKQTAAIELFNHTHMS